MLVTFALALISQALDETPGLEQPEPVIILKSTDRLVRTIQRFEYMWSDWVAASRVHMAIHQHQQLDKLYAWTRKLMTKMAVVVSDIKMKISQEREVGISTMFILDILRDARKAIKSGQMINHLPNIPQEMYVDVVLKDGSFEEVVERGHRDRVTNQKASGLKARRTKPLQCCMFVTLVLYQFLWGSELHDLVAEYEDEIVKDTFERVLFVDDARTYEL